MIKHIVFWRVEGDNKDNLISEIKSQLLALELKIPEIKEIEVGVDFNQSEVAFDVALYTSFESRQDLATYQKHPEHVKVAQFIKSVVTDRAVVDYEI